MCRVPKRYRLVIAYDGSEFAGWQIQPNGISVQEVLQAALKTVSSDTVIVHGSGRTDRGVHARGQVVHFDLEKEWKPAVLMRALNANLPDAVRVLQADTCSPSFHARRSAREKEYRYQIYNAEVVPPDLRHFRTHIRATLDIETMRIAAEFLVGRHDFAAFTANPNREVESTVRSLTKLTVTRRGSEVLIRARGDGFLYKMVRSIAGHLIRVGEGTVGPEETRVILESRTRTARVQTAPPEGLFLWRVYY